MPFTTNVATKILTPVSLFSVQLEWDDVTLRDYALYSIVAGAVHGNFTPTEYEERPCRGENPAPRFEPKHSENKKRSRDSSKFEMFTDADYRTFSDTEYDFRTGVFSDYYFRPRLRSARSLGVRGRKSLGFRRRFQPARAVSGPLGARRRVVLEWSLTETLSADAGETVAFR